LATAIPAHGRGYASSSIAAEKVGPDLEGSPAFGVRRSCTSINAFLSIQSHIYEVEPCSFGLGQLSHALASVTSITAVLSIQIDLFILVH
jgi:hypothetical protein